MVASKVIMVRPAAFGYNAETAATNSFQLSSELPFDTIQQKALEEFDRLAELLNGHGIEVVVLEDEAVPAKPDAVFPNNWLSTHADGSLFFYPMFSPLRRLERRKTIRELLKPGKVTDLTAYEEQCMFLEGTGSIVFDHKNKMAYAALSDRTNEELLDNVCAELGYKSFSFHTAGSNGQAIYHTNVVMSISDELAVVCFDCVTDKKERLKQQLTADGKDVIEISMTQMENFCGNCLMLANKAGKKYLVMSSRAYEHLAPSQIQLIEKRAGILHSPLNIIETVGGGSARCMLAECFF